VKRILLAYDGGEPARRALYLVATLAHAVGASVTVVSVAPRRFLDLVLRAPVPGEERERPSPGDHGTYPGWETWVDAPHENPFDCIRFLKKELDYVRDDLKSVEKELSNVEAPRRDTFG